MPRLIHAPASLTLRSSKAPSNSKNIVRGNKKKKKKGAYQVSKSFKQAFFKMLPTKVKRDNLSDLTMNTATSMASRTQDVQLSDITKNTTESLIYNRTGTEVYIVGVRVNGTIQSNETAKTKFVRIMILRNNNMNADTLNTTDFHNLYLDEDYSESAPNGTQRDGRLHINTDVVKVYSDRTFVIKAENQDAVPFDYWVPIRWTSRYAIDATSGTDPKNGRIYAISNLYEGDNETTATTVIFSCQTTLYFKDGQRSVN